MGDTVLGAEDKKINFVLKELAIKSVNILENLTLFEGAKLKEI